MRNIYIFVLLLCSVIINAEQLNTYNFIPVKIIQTGKEVGQIGWQPAMAGGASGPTAFCINKAGEIYVPDRVNYRVNLYDLNFNYLKTIIEKEKKYVHFTNKMKVDEKGNIIYITAVTGLRKINTEGETLLSIDYKILPRNVKNRRNFFPINDLIFIYNDDNQIEYITAKGEFMRGENVRTKMKELTGQKRTQVTDKQLLSIEEKVFPKLYDDHSLLIIDDQFYSTDFYKTKDYFNSIKEVQNYVATQQKANRSNNVVLNIDDFSMHFIDYDAKHNSYWRGSIDKSNEIIKYAIIIYSQYGELLDAFYYGQFNDNEPNNTLYPTSEAIITVAPDGDVYFLTGNKKEYTFYKVESTW